MLEGTINISGREIPRTLLGTSPFTGIEAAHFGHRAMLYQLDFHENPEKVAEIIRKSYEMGVRGIQLIPHPWIVEALKMAVEVGCDMDIIGTVRPENSSDDVATLSELGASAMILHPATVDKMDFQAVEEDLQLVRDEGAVSGVATSFPFQITERLIGSSVSDLFDIYMIPLNRLGYLMDCEGYQPEDRVKLEGMIKKLDKTVLASKTLAAGILQPSEAFDYIKTVDYVDMVSVGIGSVAEAEETFRIIASK
ncbi:hypothetical protein [Methanobacterium aggregans]|uniref:hypothetical protein n=1 Tax=Methanobacterium aggregans TaxID=1615586 RepID=UPI001AE46531|nr:hypothetical protein [Methanobacterium aggregans]MBP2046187.1 hypothetical protein [Methanobacterium aggregans]